MAKFVEVGIGDKVKLKKQHACGANEWLVTKLGMDIGLQCLKCGRKLRLLRADFDRSFRKYLEQQRS